MFVNLDIMFLLLYDVPKSYLKKNSGVKRLYHCGRDYIQQRQITGRDYIAFIQIIIL